MLECKIDKRRKDMCYTRAGLARKCNIPYSTMLRLCRGDFKRLKYQHLESLCRVLQCTPGDLLDYTREE